jgi:hypothetical protein
MALIRHVTASPGQPVHYPFVIKNPAKISGLSVSNPYVSPSEKSNGRLIPS